MELMVVGASHRTAEIEVRERFFVSREAVEPFLERVTGHDTVREGAVLSTCNRTELFLHAEDPEGASEHVTAVLAEHAGLPPVEVEPHLYRLEGREGVAHLLRVVAGLDSLVVGEPQIQGQVREAYEAARGGGGHVGPVLHRLFQTALSAGGEVRDRTGISEGAASVPAAGVQLAAKVFGSLEGRRAAVIGAGEMGQMTLRALVDRGIEEASVASRTLDRARDAADRIGAGPVEYERLLEELSTLDIVVTSTSAPHPVLTVEQVERVRRQRPDPLVVVDIAVPRDVEAGVGDLPGVFLYNIDDLQRVVRTTERDRVAERTDAEALLEEGLRSFWRWYRGREVVPLIRRIREEAERVREREMEEALERVEGLSPEEKAELHRASRLALKKVLHAPTVGLRRMAAHDDGQDLLEAARRLFDAGDDRADEEEPSREEP